MTRLLAPILVVAVFALVGCANMTPTQQRALSGGPALGATTGGSLALGAVVGGVGVAASALMGK